MLYKVSHLIPHKHLIYFIRHSLYIHLYQDRTTNSQLSHAVLSPRTPNARQTPRGRQDNHTDTSFITSTLNGNYRPSDLFIEPVNTTPSYGKPYVHNTMDGQMSHMDQHIVNMVALTFSYLVTKISHGYTTLITKLAHHTCVKYVSTYMIDLYMIMLLQLYTDIYQAVFT